jgi:glycosyltransferase involved in cell wall biosynthesis
MTMRGHVPWRLRAPVRRTRNAARVARAAASQWRRWRSIAATTPRRGELAVSYGVESMPGASDVVFGGAVKFQVLHRALPNAPRDFNVLYLGSTSMPIDAGMLLRLARRRGAAFVWNQNGVAYRGWYGDGWELVNRPGARMLREADHVVFQSAFCKLGADTFYGEPSGPWEILHNPVDTTAFVPAAARPSRPLTLLLGGNQYQRYRVECALETLALVRRERRDARLVIAGELSFAPDGRDETLRMIGRLGLDDAVELTGAYAQSDAPALVQRGDLLLHTKYNDPCPTIVLEAMACGLPVAYSATGGTPELVGDDAGIGVEGPLDWETEHPPEPERLAAGVVALAGDLEARRAAARERALRFDARAWVERHREIFEMLVR